MADKDVSHRMATRPKNAVTHPGNNEVPKRKRRTKEEMKAAREKEDAAKEATILKAKKAVERVAAIERQINEDENDKTPRQALPNTRSQTRSTTCDPVLMVESSDGPRSASNSVPVDNYQPSCSDSNAEDALSVEEETPVKKKARTDKPSFRDAVKVQNAVVSNARKLYRTYASADLAGPHDNDAVLNKTQPEGTKKKAAGVIDNWRNAVEIQPAARVNTSKTGSTGPSTGSVRSESTTLFKSTTTNPTLNETVIAALEDEETEEFEHDDDACGGLADEFELDGPEGKFARLSPFKGKKRITNDGIVKVERGLKQQEGLKPNEIRRPKKYRNEDLPESCMENGRFRKKFIPTVFWYTAFSSNPWNIANQDAENAMLCIWSVVYKNAPKVGNMNDAVIAITTQRLCDTYHSVIASSAVSILADVINSDPGLKTDEDIQAFCSVALQDDFFIYSNTNSDDPKGYAGPFRSPLIVRTFAAHFSAIHGTVKVPALGDPAKPKTYPCGGLALSAAAMARALTLCKIGAITIDMIQVSKKSGKPLVFTKAINKASGKESFKDTAFSFANWGLKTMEYLAMIREDLREKSRQKIRTQAHEYYKINRPQSSLTTASAFSMDNDEPEGSRRRILDLSDDED